MIVSASVEEGRAVTSRREERRGNRCDAIREAKKENTRREAVSASRAEEATD
jgi:hypothetical protein